MTNRICAGGLIQTLAVEIINAHGDMQNIRIGTTFIITRRMEIFTEETLLKSQTHHSAL